VQVHTSEFVFAVCGLRFTVCGLQFALYRNARVCSDIMQELQSHCNGGWSHASAATAAAGGGRVWLDAGICVCACARESMCMIACRIPRSHLPLQSLLLAQTSASGLQQLQLRACSIDNEAAAGRDLLLHLTSLSLLQISGTA
jgi:hypothetical protein